MKELQKNEMSEVKGGAGFNSTMLNAIARAVSVIFSIGQSVGSALRRITGQNYC